MRIFFALLLLVGSAFGSNAQTIEIIPLDEAEAILLEPIDPNDPNVDFGLEPLLSDENGTSRIVRLEDDQFQTYEQKTEMETANMGRVRVLDQMSGRTTDLVLQRDETGTVGRIRVTLFECRFPVENPTSDAFIRLAVEDLDANPLFEGWMVASSPALMALDHPRYDVWAIDCAVRAPNPEIVAGVRSPRPKPRPVR